MKKEPKEVKCEDCKEVVKRKDAVQEVTGKYYCKACYCGWKKCRLD